MSGFDCIRFNCDFVLPHLQDMTFQTKNFYRSLDNYVVSEHGRLLLENITYETVPESKRPYFGTEDWNTNPFVQLIGATDEKIIDRVFIKHSGLIKFNGFYLSPDGHDIFYDFQAGFDNGILIFISVLEERTLDNEFV